MTARDLLFELLRLALHAHVAGAYQRRGGDDRGRHRH